MKIKRTLEFLFKLKSRSLSKVTGIIDEKRIEIQVDWIQIIKSTFTES